MDAVEVLFARRSTGRLVAPPPADRDLDTILRAAAAAPDHERLRPFRFTVLGGAAKDDFGEVLAGAYDARCAAAGAPALPAKREKERTKLGRAPLVLVVSAVRVPSAAVPWPEQLAAVAAAAQNACLAATALGFGSMWRTGEPSYDPTVKAALGLDEPDAVVGWIYLGSYRDGVVPGANDPDLSGLLLPWPRHPPLPSTRRPDDARPIHTGQLPDTPTRDRTIVATAWVEAPAELLRLGADLGHDKVGYLRRIHGWLLWRAGPPSGGDARYMALWADDLGERHVLRLFADGTAEGVGPSGTTHTRFRSWKEDLRDAGMSRG